MSDRLGAVVDPPPRWVSAWNEDDGELVLAEPAERLPPGAFRDLLTVRPLPGEDPAVLADRALWLIGEQVLDRLETLDRGPCTVAGLEGEHVLLHGYLPGPYALIAEGWWVRDGARAWCLLGVTVPLLYAVGGPVLEQAVLSLRPA